MNKITVYRTRIEIADYSLGDNPLLERTFSIYDKTYHRLYPMGIEYNKDTRILTVPRSTSIFNLEKDFNTQAVVDYSYDTIRYFNRPLQLKYSPRDEVQKEALMFMLGKGPYNNNRNKTMLSLNLNTGKGKSYCAIATVAYKGMTTAIITSTLGCLDQWDGYFKEYTDIQPNEMYRLNGSPSIGKLYKMDISNYKVFFISHDTLQSYASSNGIEAVTELFKYLGIGIKIYDEAHQNFENMMMIDYHTNTNVTYYLTATLGRSDFDENRIFQIYFKGVPSIDLFNRDEDPHTAYAGIKYNSCPTPTDISNCNNAYGMSTAKYADYVVDQPMFHNMLHILVQQAMRKPGKCLWYIGTNNAILKVRDWIYDNYPELVRQVGIYTTLTPKEHKREQLDKKIILSTTKSAGAAMDIKGLVETVNLAEPFKSRVLAQQSFGRTRADNTIYKDLVDMGFSQSRAYYNHKKPVFSKYATSCKEIVLKTDELQARADAIRQQRENLVFPIVFEDDRRPGSK